MTEAMLEIILRRDRIIVAAALAALTALAWTYVLWLAADMGGMEMTGFRMVPAGMGIMAPALAPWQAIEFVYVFAMWAVMMVGMMTPSAAPMILIYARVGRQALAQGKPFAATGWFAAGYLLTWVGFALVATVAQWALERTALLDPKMASASQVFGGIVLIAAGVHQWTPLKDKCLAQCQSPLLFIQRQGGFQRDPSGSMRLGLRHGAYCVGCCWVLMALLFVGGVMNALWIAAISAFVLIEKIVPVGRLISRIAGAGFVAAGISLVVGL
jgi:predicted metal-binding membrane protein